MASQLPFDCHLVRRPARGQGEPHEMDARRQAAALVTLAPLDQRPLAGRLLDVGRHPVALIVLPTLMIVAEDLAARARATWAWGQGRAPLPWRRPAAAMGGGGEPELATRTRRS